MYIPPRRPMMLPMPFVRPSGAPSEGKMPHPSMDPRDGASPPALPDRSPANPVAVAALLSGNPNVTEANVTAILGAPVAQLIRDKSSILYGGGKSSTKSSGAIDGQKSSKVVSVFVPNAKGSPPPAPPVPAPTKATPINGGALVEWATTRLAENGIRCDEWTAMGEPARINTTRNFFYGVQSLLAVTQLALAGVSLPTSPEDLRDAINIACGLPIGPRDARISSPAALSAPREQSATWWASARAAGVTCDQWYAAQEWQRYQMVQSLAAQRIIDRGPWSDWQVMQAIGAECQRSVEPATSDPTASIRARLRAILDCANLDAQDKLQQIAVIQRAFPELNRDPRALYRLGLARYDACHPSTEPGWHGQGDQWLARFGQAIQESVQSGHSTDPLGGDVAGMSLAQWVKQGPYMPSTGPDLFDPIQGATGDCYFVAAMASCAWTRPTQLAQIATRVGPDRLRFQLGAGEVITSERVPTAILAAYQPVFARGNRIDAQWPGVLEKAWAIYRTGDRNDRPNITAIDNEYIHSRGGRNPTFDVIPLLVGGQLFWHLSTFRSDDAFFDLLATYCTPDGRARVPMVAGTYTDGGFVDRTGLVANHAYSVLGFGFHRDGRKFVVLRNPWGSSWAGLPSSEYLVPVEGRWLNRLNLNHGDGGCFALAHGAFSAAFSVLYGAQ